MDSKVYCYSNTGTISSVKFSSKLLMVQLMVKFTGRITFAFILQVNFNSIIDSKNCR